MRVCICLGWVGLLRWNSIIGHSVGAGAGLGIVIQLGSSERRLLGCDLAMLTQRFIGIEWALSVVHSARSIDTADDTAGGSVIKMARGRHAIGADHQVQLEINEEDRPVITYVIQ